MSNRLIAESGSSGSAAVIADLDDPVPDADRVAVYALVCGRLQRFAGADGELGQVPRADRPVAFDPAAREVAPEMGAQVVDGEVFARQIEERHGRSIDRDRLALPIGDFPDQGRFEPLRHSPRSTAKPM